MDNKMSPQRNRRIELDRLWRNGAARKEFERASGFGKDMGNTLNYQEQFIVWGEKILGIEKKRGTNDLS